MNSIRCPVCGNPISVRMAKGRKSNKPFIMLICPVDGRHLRGFISHQEFVRGVLEEQASRRTGGTPGGTGTSP